jgi:hypothetical protein
LVLRVEQLHEIAEALVRFATDLNRLLDTCDGSLRSGEYDGDFNHDYSA